MPVVEYGSEAFNLSVLNKEHLNIPPRRFPGLSEDLMEKHVTDTLKANPPEEVTNCRYTVHICMYAFTFIFNRTNAAVVFQIQLVLVNRLMYYTVHVVCNSWCDTTVDGERMSRNSPHVLIFIGMSLITSRRNGIVFMKRDLTHACPRFQIF